MNNYNAVIEHDGTKGMRWGVRNADWYPIAAWKAHLNRIKTKHNEAKTNKQKKENLKKANAAKKANAEAKRIKEKVIKTGDINKANEIFDRLTNEEVAAVKARNQARLDISKARTDEILTKLGTMADVTSKILTITNNGIGMYNNFAKVANTFGDSELLIIGQANNQQKKKTE